MPVLVGFSKNRSGMSGNKKHLGADVGERICKRKHIRPTYRLRFSKPAVHTGG